MRILHISGLYLRSRADSEIQKLLRGLEYIALEEPIDYIFITAAMPRMISGEEYARLDTYMRHVTDCCMLGLQKLYLCQMKREEDMTCHIYEIGRTDNYVRILYEYDGDWHKTKNGRKKPFPFGLLWWTKI